MRLRQLKQYVMDFGCGQHIQPEEGFGGWSGGAMVLGKLPVPGRPTIWIAVGQAGPRSAIGRAPDS